MTNAFETSPLYPIANPRSIAFLGASNSLATMGTNILRPIMMFGYTGKIYPVHRSETEVQGLTAYRSVMDLPEIPDLAFIVLPTHIVCQALEECGKKGIRSAVIVSAGFGEIGGEGKQLQHELLAIARKYDIRFMGPNCIGVVNPHRQFNATIMPYETVNGFIGIASQSGSFVTQMFEFLKRFGLGFSTGFSLGNEADLDMVDALAYLGACPHTKVIALYVESIRRGREFIDVARSVTPHKPVVAFYVGGTEGGKRACLSHTGALAGSDKLYDGVFRQSGIIRARSIEEMFDFCFALGASPLPKGNRVVIQTHSGGPGAAAADSCSRAGVTLPSLSRESKDRLAEFMPHTASSANPVDITYNKRPLDYFSAFPKILLEDDNTDILLAYYLVSERSVRRVLLRMDMPEDEINTLARQLIDQQCDSIAGLLENYKKPIIGYSFHTRDNLFVRGLQDRNVPIMPSPERAGRAAGALVMYRDLRNKILGSEPSD